MEFTYKTTPRGTFTYHFSTYTGSLTRDDHADVYWAPKTGTWQTLTPGQWSITDKGLPSITFEDHKYTEAERVFDAISQQREAMTTQDRESAVWDPRRRRWVIATSPTDRGTKDQEFQRRLQDLEKLLRDGTITPGDFDKRKDALIDWYYGAS